MKHKHPSRRSLLAAGASFGAGSLAGVDLLGLARALAEDSPWKPEQGAKLSVLRWKRFVPAEDEAFIALVQAFTKATGVEVSISNESFDDIQPKASVAANTGQGPDLVWGLHSLPHLFPDKVVDMSDVATYLGKKYGGWVPSAEQTCRLADGRWLAVPVAYNGGYMNYRIKAMNDAGFKEFPKDTAGFLELCRAMKAKNTPAGFAFGHATGDANGWLHWLLWSHGGLLVDKDDKVIINSPETAKALEYAKALYETFIPGTASWNDSSNNKAFLAGELYLTSNGISIYAAALADAGKDPRMKAIADDMDHALYPNGPIGKALQLALCFPMLCFKYSKAPNAAKAFTVFLMESAQYGPWLAAAVGYLTGTLYGYDDLPFWTADPKRTVFRNTGKDSYTAAGVGHMNEKAAAALSDFIVVDMFASYVTGNADLKGAMDQAERAAKRIYR